MSATRSANPNLAPGARPELDGRLAERFDELASLCHKINNPLTSLMGRAQILSMRDDLDERVVKAVGVIDESSRRIAELVRELSQVVCHCRDDLDRNS